MKCQSFSWKQSGVFFMAQSVLMPLHSLSVQLLESLRFAVVCVNNDLFYKCSGNTLGVESAFMWFYYT